jgi:hypothetical protein
VAVIPTRDRDLAARLPFEFWESKFHPPTVRAGIVRRASLVNRLAAVEEPVITVVAPPGYGKTTLLARWAELVGPRVAWISCDDGDNDPVVLLGAVAVALDRIEPVDPAISGALVSSGGGIAIVPRLVSALASMHRPIRMVFDHAEAVTSKECLMMLAEFALRLPRGWQLAFASPRTRSRTGHGAQPPAAPHAPSVPSGTASAQEIILPRKEVSTEPGAIQSWRCGNLRVGTHRCESPTGHPVHKSVHKPQAKGRLLDRNRPLCLVAGAGFEPATSGL